jgi:tripartite-type tricarboxylate transporter receptor subunit TctC
MLAPAGTPQSILRKVSQDIAKVLMQSDVREKMQRQGALPSTNTPEQFDAMIRDDTVRNSKLLRDAGIGTR